MTEPIVEDQSFIIGIDDMGNTITINPEEVWSDGLPDLDEEEDTADIFFNPDEFNREQEELKQLSKEFDFI